MRLVNEATIMDITVQILEISIFHSIRCITWISRDILYIFSIQTINSKLLSQRPVFVRVKIKNTRKLFKNYKCNKNKNIKHYNISQRIPFASKRLSLPPPPSPFRKDRSRGSDLFSNYLRPARNALTSRYSPPLHTPDRERERENNIIPFNFTKSKINFSQSRTKYDEITNFRSALYEVTE